MKRLIALALAGLCISGQSFAGVDEQEIDLLREQIRILSERLDRLEETAARQPDRQAAGGTTGKAAVTTGEQEEIEAVVDQRLDQRLAQSWTERIRWKGDFRYRYENIATEDREDRNRQRIRARAHLEAGVSDTVRIGLGLASGGDDPVSTNQTLGGGGSTKGINLDLAYFRWSGLPDTYITGGKFKNVFYRPGKNGLLWDGDWNPEGAAFYWDRGKFFASGIGTWVESDSAKFNQEFSYGGQAGFNLPLAPGVSLIAGTGYYRFDTAGKRSFFGDDDDFFGNSFDPETLRYIFNYQEVEAFAELSFELFDRPASVFADYVTNLDADENDMGYALGLKTGKAKAPGDWELSLIYQDLEADAVLGLLTDSDFGGGGTDVRGYILKGSYAIHEYWKAKFTYFINDINPDSKNPRDFDRLQLDLNFKYQ